MKKIILGALLLSSFSFAQVGVNTSNPQSTFHIDGAKDNSATGTPTAAQQLNDFSVGLAGDVGVGTTTPTEKVDIAEGNLRVRNIVNNTGIANTDKIVVADANGVLKTLETTTDNYKVFHARLDTNLTLVSGVALTIPFSAPLTTTPMYSYNASTGVLTFNEPGNYWIYLQGSFVMPEAQLQSLLGIRPVPDGNYLGRATHYNARAGVNSGPTQQIGELTTYSTMLIVPNAGFQIRFTAASTFSAGLQWTPFLNANEIGGTGGGNVTNVTVQKI